MVKTLVSKPALARSQFFRPKPGFLTFSRAKVYDAEDDTPPNEKVGSYIDWGGGADGSLVESFERLLGR